MTDDFLRGRPGLTRSLRYCFPGASEQDVEDALYGAYADLLPRVPQSGRFNGLIYRVAWRKLRGLFRSHGRRRAAPSPVLESITRPAGQEAYLAMSRWLLTFERVVKDHGHPHEDALRRALLDKMWAQESDVAIAARHKIRRERLNRAWNDLLRELLPD